MKALLILLVFVLCSPALSADKTSPERDWLFGKQIELYAYLFVRTDIPDLVRNNLQAGFHKFAFEYWLLCQTKPVASSPWWRYQVRSMLHREAKNDRYFNDPATLLPFFKDGKFVPAINVAPIAGLELLGLSESNYLTLVRGFQSTFFDATNAFPARPVPDGSAIAVGQTEEHLAIVAPVAGKAWPLLSRDKLPIRYQNDPYRVFKLFNGTGKAYYLPAFLRMCERDADQIGDLPSQLLSELTSEDPQSIELRSTFTVPQKRCIAAFFEDWFTDNTKNEQSLNKLRNALRIEPRTHHQP